MSVRQSDRSARVSDPTSASAENSTSASNDLYARTWSTTGRINRGCRESSRETITSLLSRNNKTSQKTMLNANSIRPYPSTPNRFASDNVTMTEVVRQITSAALKNAKFDAIRRRAGLSTRRG
jgi:hypothetical protein